jgi:predicted transcriptional regulator
MLVQRSRGRTVPQIAADVGFSTTTILKYTSATSEAVACLLAKLDARDRRDAQVRALHDAGTVEKDIARRLHLSPTTVQAILDGSPR